MKSRTFILISILALIFSITSNAQVTSGLRIVSGKVDTVFRASHYIVGAAKPGSEIFINGISVKQYKTGSFGMEINLVEGNNPIEVRVRNSNEDIRESFSVYYKLQSPQSMRKSVKDTLPYNGLVITTLPGAYLNYSAGDDRLGGAKINFISEGINMAVIDSTGDLYKVRLSENRYCFLPKEYAKKVPFGTNPPFTITGSWSVSKNDKCDRVRISLQERVPYTLSFELDPSKIIVDLYSAQCNSNWITQYLDLEAIDYVDFAQIESDVFRVIIKLKSNKCWGYTAEYSDNSLVISVKHSPNPTL
ncbi:MAG TPA: AMIN domain-containing protein, partial [Bacteroidales bacterium]|nr:AMIN domain-containing protein [Bacteroidales bacterium]